jgi:CBS domain-containing protein
MKTVGDILKTKASHQVHTIAPDASVLDAIKSMAEYGIGALIVMENDEIVGIVTERDYSRKVILMNRSSSTTPVRDIMTSNVIYVRPADSNEECMALMTEKRLRHLPVMEDGRLVGMVSIGDLVKDIIQEQEFIITQLERYISGVRG